MSGKKIIGLSIIFSLFSFAGVSYAQDQEVKKELSLSTVVGSRMIDKLNYNELILQPEFNKGKFGIGLNLLFLPDEIPSNLILRL